MKFCFFILLFACLFLLHLKAQSHQDSWHVMTFDNVRVRIKTGLECEEIKKSFIIGELAAKLAKELNYKKPILLSFHHNYIVLKESEDYDYYSIKIGKGKYDKRYSKRFDKRFALKKNGIVISQRDDFFEAGKTLQLLEYAIENVGKLKQSVPASRKLQIPIIASIDSISYLKNVPILKKQPSDRVTTFLQTKVYAYNGTLNYYYKEDSFHFVKIEGKDTSDLIQLKNVVLTRRNIVFDTDTSFYYLDKQVSDRHTVNLRRDEDQEKLRYRVNEFKMRLNVEKLDSDLFGFSYPVRKVSVKSGRSYNTFENCYSIYFARKDYFAQDIEHLLLEQKNKHN